uniref:FZ domain-containing protein n=1 Tax=Parascaris equorum TaxID=6256 RepID=A0A914RRT7_PAREQ
MANAKLLLLLLLHTVLFTLVVRSAYISESWAMLTSDRPSAPKCVEIPRNLTLCYGIQAAPWIPLHRLNCHPDTQGCEGRMRQYGFPWPEMLSCKKYPADNDMCIGTVSEKSSGIGFKASIIRARRAVRSAPTRTYSTTTAAHRSARIGTVNESHVNVRKARSLKRSDRKRSVVKDTIIHFSADRGCPCPVSGSADARFLIMADQNEKGDFIANLILPWNNTDKPFKRAIRSFRKLNCQSLGREIRESAYRLSARRSTH